MKSSYEHFEMAVTPKIAKDWLENSKIIRGTHAGNLKNIALEMEAGTFKNIGDPLQFDKNNHLLNGRHRLSALIQTGKTINFLIVKGLDPASIGYMDLGAKRNLSEYFQGLGVKNAQISSSIARYLYGWDTRLKDIIKYGNFSREYFQYLNFNTIWEFYQKKSEEIETAKTQFLYGGSVAGIEKSILCFCFIVLSRLDAAKAQQFFSVWESGLIPREGNWRNLINSRDEFLAKKFKGFRANAKMGVIFGLWNSIYHDFDYESLSEYIFHIPKELL